MTNASDALCSALWALDYMHWWVAHGASGVNFQNTEWLRTDTFYLDSAGNYQIHPKAYAIKAFDLGGHGTVQSLVIGNEGGINLTAYAVRGETDLFVTVINKEHGPGGRSASVAVVTDGFGQGNAERMFLAAPNGDAGATTGITIGGATITNNASWRGQWTPVTSSPANDRCAVALPASSAAVIRITDRRVFKHP